MEWVPGLLAFLVATLVAFLTMPPLIRKMIDGGMVGRDVNKGDRRNVAELGGIAALFAFAISLSLVVGFEKLVGNIDEPPFLAAIAVFFIASMIGLIDDISNIKQRFKAIVLVFASLPLLLVHYRVVPAGDPLNIVVNSVIDLPFGASFNLTSIPYLYWLVLVPLGVTGVANAMNMSAGYNGLESGQIVIVSASLLVISLTRGLEVSFLVFAALAGAALGMFWFNRHPARVFVGDIGTLGMGAAIAAGAIMGGVEIYGLIAIAPAFYEAGATFYYSVLRNNHSRREAYHNPQIGADGSLHPPADASRYTLAFLILSKRPMTEPRLVSSILGLYAISGLAAIVLSLV